MSDMDMFNLCREMKRLVTKSDRITFLYNIMKTKEIGLATFHFLYGEIDD